MKQLVQRSILVFLLLIGVTAIWAQCDIPPSTDNCENAPILCNFDEIDGYCTSMSQIITGNGPSPLCAQGGAPHNTIWFAFYAGCTSLTITLTPTNCVPVGGQLGIQAAIYGYGGNGLCPDSHQQPAQEIACQSQPCFDTPWTLQANGMTVGQIYYFMIDGCAGSYCDISIDLLTPCGAPAIDNWPGPIQGPLTICTGATGVYTTPQPTGGIEYYWYLEGSQIQAGPDPSVSVTWTSAGTYELCVDVSNQCVAEFENPVQQCVTVNVYDVTPEDPQPRLICEDSTTIYNGQAYTPGTYDVLLKTPQQCDSLVTLEVIGDPNVETDLGTVYLCPSDVVYIGSVQWDYSNQGLNEYTISKLEFPNCDSLIKFEIVGLYTDAYVFPPPNLGCVYTTLTLDGQGSVAGPFPAIVNYQWFAYNGGVLGSPSDQPTMNIEDPGKYCLRVEVVAPDGSTSCWDSMCVIVNMDSIPHAIASASINPPVLTCANPSITLTGNSNTPGTSKQWQGPGGPYPINQSIITTNLPGTYSYVVTDPSGCANSAEIIVTEDITKPNLSGTGGTITCANPNVNLVGNSNTPGATFLWKNSMGATIGNAQTIQAPGAGTFTLVVTNPVNGCPDSVNVVVDQNTILPVPTAATQTLTCLLPNPPLTGGSNVPNATYTWSFGGNTYSTQKDTVAHQSGQFTLTVFDPVNGCSKDTVITVPEDTAQPDLLAIGDSMDCIKTTATLQGSSNTPGATFQWFDNTPTLIGTTQNVTVSNPGTYELVVTGTNGCSSSTTAEVILDAVIPTINISGTDDTINCAVTSIELTGTSNMSVTYQWNKLPSSSSIGSSDKLIINSAGTYRLVVTAANGCTNEATINIGEDLVPPVIDMVQGGVIDCATDSIQLLGSSSTPGVTYQWYNFNGVPLTPLGSASPFTKATGTFTLEVTGYNGCTATANATVTSSPDKPQNVLATVTNTITCAQPTATINVTSSTPGVTYFWSGPGVSNPTNPSNVVTINGTYDVTVTDPGNGCKEYASVLVEIDTIHPVLVPSGNLIDCRNPSVGISVTSNPSTNVTYAWTSPSNTPFGGNVSSINVIQSGNWQVVVTNNTNGCSSSVIVPVTENTVDPTVSISQPGPITCTNASRVLNTTVSTAVDYIWSGPDINASNNTISDPTISLPGTYSVTVTDPVNGCTGTASIIITEDVIKPQISMTGLTLNCFQPTQTLSANVTPNSGTSITWTLDGNPIPGNSSSISVNQPGQYTIQVTNLSNGCVEQLDATVILDDVQPDASASGAEITCLTPQVQIFGNSTTPQVTYSWVGPGGYSSQLQSPTNITVPGLYTLTVTSSVNGCVRTVSTNVTEDRVLPTAAATTSNVIDCSNPTTTLSSTGSTTGATITYAWTAPGGGLAGTGATLTGVIQTGLWTLVVTNTANGCSNTANVLVTDNQNLPTGVDLDLNDPNCFGFKDGSILVAGVTGGTPPFTYSLNGGPFTPNAQFNGLGDGSYTITVRDGAGCLYTSPAYQLTEPLKLEVELGDDFIMQWGRDTYLYAIILPPSAVIESIQWTPVGVDTTFNSREIYIKPFNQTLYGVVVTDASGCKAEDKVLVLVEKRRPVYIPNVFHPNGEQNTRFYIQVGEGIEEIEAFEVFNRWGERVFSRFNFQPNDPSLGWDGVFRNKPANPEVFVYYAKIRFNDGITLLYKGDVTLMR